MNDRLAHHVTVAERLRIETLGWVAAHPRATADEVAAGVHERLGAVSERAVLDVLRVCADTGLLRRVELAGHPVRFEASVADDHYLVCRRCGRTVDVDHVEGLVPCLDPAHSAGFVVDGAEVVFRGFCPDCTTRTNT